MNEDEEIIRQIKAGNITAFNELFKSLYIQLYFHCRKFIADPEEAKDLMQNVFLRFWERREEIDIRTSLRAYLFRSVSNECLNYLRSVHPSSLEGESAEQLTLAASDSYDMPDRVLAVVEIERIVRDTIRRFPRQCKLIFALSRFRGLRNQQIADRLNISVRTVDTQIYRALKILKGRLKDYMAFY